jgi:DNA-binding PadR family transcriptional regulator
MREIADRTEDDVRLGAATLYRCIKRLLEAGLIVESAQRPDPELDDERRRYYRLTEVGEEVTRREAQRLARLVQSAYRKRLIDAPGFAG